MGIMMNSPIVKSPLPRLKLIETCYWEANSIVLIKNPPNVNSTTSQETRGERALQDKKFSE